MRWIQELKIQRIEAADEPGKAHVTGRLEHARVDLIFSIDKAEAQGLWPGQVLVMTIETQ